ncbi:MAG: Tfp pilus assembly protein FimT/FimU [Candidatus Saccharibacteria bacterium]
MLFVRVLKGIKSQDLGYTLVELLSVLAIVGILSVLLFPKYRSVSNHLDFRRDADILAVEFRQARQTAITTGEKCELIFKLNASSYIVKEKTRPSREIKLGQGTRVVKSTFPLLGTGQSHCSFSPFGAPAGGGTVCLENSHGNRLYIPVSPVTGRVRVTETEPE